MSKINGNHIAEKETPELIYVYDALCGWCYGFSPVITRLKEEFNEKIDFLVLSGGMVRGENAGPIGQIAGYIKQAYKTVEDATGVKFGQKFLDEVLEKGDAIFTSLPPALALAVFRLEQPGEAIEFAARLQKAIYYDGRLVDDKTLYSQIASGFDVDGDELVRRMDTDEIAQMVENEFKMVAGMGVNGYPTLVMRNGKELKILTRGYQPYEQVEALIRQHID
ncbi:MAG: DsbA family protein [Bacteroidetes bacterium]|nr:MAG: DsbA family protein [Bacteroidota bacterium]